MIIVNLICYNLEIQSIIVEGNKRVLLVKLNKRIEGQLVGVIESIEERIIIEEKYKYLYNGIEKYQLSLGNR